MLTVIWKILCLSFIIESGYARHTKTCRDNHVWVADGSVDCAFLEKPSDYGVHVDPEFWCNNPLTDCCATCFKMRKAGVIGTNKIQYPPASNVQTIVE